MKKIIAPFMLVTLTAALSACDSGTETPKPVNPSTTAINGQVVSGSGTGTVTLNGSAGVLATAPVDASGNFTMALPSASQLGNDLVAANQAISKIGCAGTVNSSAANANGFGVFPLKLMRGTVSDNAIAGNLQVNRILGIPTSGSFDGRVWLYVDQDTTLSTAEGQPVNCESVFAVGIPVNITVNASVKAGWNILQLSGSASPGLSGIAINGSLTTISDSTTQWRTLTDLKSQLQ